jgi:predicted GIY-YIG superfamily endonuclease
VSYFVYILKCGDGSFYTGYTSDLENRVRLHNQGKASRYTRGKLPVSCMYRESHPDKSGAMRREAEIKRLRRKKKLMLINSQAPLRRPSP